MLVIKFPTRVYAFLIPLSASAFRTERFRTYNSCMGVPPSPFTRTAISSSDCSDIPSASKSCETILSATVSASCCFSRLIPGSPCMPTPYSISSSPISNVGVPLAGTVQEVKAKPIDFTDDAVLWAIAFTSSRLHPANAAAPAILCTKTVPATPRRPTV